MNNPKTISGEALINSFLECTESNWRHSFYIECHCKYEKTIGCGDFLFVPAANGQPILLPVGDAEIIFSIIVDKSECLGKMSNLLFVELYGKYLSHRRPAPQGKCPLLYEIFQ